MHTNHGRIHLVPVLAAAMLLVQGLRKPAPAAFEAVTSHLSLPARRLVLVDDRQVNVDAAAQAGMTALRFRSAAELESDLKALGLDF